MHLASIRGGLGCVLESLIEKGADVNAKDLDKRTPLHFASQGRDWDTVKFLIEKGANVKKRDCDKRTPLHLASQGMDYEDVATTLVEKGVDVSPRDLSIEDRTFFPLQEDCANVVKTLIENGAGVNKRDYYKRTPLHFASQVGAMSVVKALIENGADIGKVDRDGKLPINFPMEMNNPEMAKEIIRCSLSFNTNLEKPSPVEDNDFLSSFWDKCKTELAQKYDSSISLHKFLLETDKNKLAGYLSTLQEGLEEAQHTSIYHDMIRDQIDKGKESVYCLILKLVLILVIQF